ncbi:MAG: glycosyltransferase family 39 protein, partial [Elusimicrobia bacterium]|nr:glycosyltransferase family 39 protein [Elusimicrobiota bacterium]
MSSANRGARRARPEPRAAWRLKPQMTGCLALAWGLGLGWYFYSRPDWVQQWRMWRMWPQLPPPIFQMRPAALLSLLKDLACLAGLTLLAHGLGRRLLSWLEPETASGEALPCLAAGWGALGLGMLGLGLLKLWRPPLVLVLLAGLGAWALWDLLKTPPRFESRPAEPWRAWDMAWAAGLAIFAGLNLAGALVPEIFYDALVYHLALPELYWLRGGIVPTPEIAHSGFPMLTQMLYGLCLPLGGDQLTHLLNWSFNLGTALLLYDFGRRFCARGAGLLAALLYYSMPLVGLLGWKASAEPAWAFFQTAALYALARGYCVVPSSREWLAAAGTFMGLAMGTKYQAWPALPILALSWLVLAREPWRSRLSGLGWFLGPAALLAAPWLIKNAAFYSNPLYPFFHDSLACGLADPDWRRLLREGGGRDIAAVLTSWQGISSWAGIHWAAMFEYSESVAGPTLLMAAPLFLLCRFLPPFNLAWLAGLGLCAAGMLSTVTLRYLLPCFPAVCLIFAVALHEAAGSAL